MLNEKKFKSVVAKKFYNEQKDEQLLIDEVGFEPSWRFHHIPIISGEVKPNF